MEQHEALARSPRMGSMDEILARIRSAGTAPAQTVYPASDPDGVVAKMAASHRAYKAAQAVRGHVPAPPPPQVEPEYVPPADTRPPVIPVVLPPYVTTPNDFTRETAHHLIRNRHPDQYDSDEDYEADVDRAYAREIAQRESVGARCLVTLNGRCAFSDEPVIADCPACSPDSKALELTCEITQYEVRGRCARGCEPAAIARALAPRVVALEHSIHAMVLSDAFAAAAAEVSIVTAFGDAPEQKWVIPRLVPADGLVLLGGTSGSGKTFIAMHAALCVAANCLWFERPVREMRTLLVLLEGGQPDRARRLGLLAAGLGITLAELGGRLDLLPSTVEFHADDPESMRALARTIQTLGHKFVVIDNLTNARANTDENSSANLGAALKPLADLAHQQGIGILLLHHTNVRGELRGSSAIRQHVDSVFELKRSSPKNTSPILMSRTKDRYGASLEELRFRFVDSFSDDGEVHLGITAVATPECRPDPEDLVRDTDPPDRDAPPPAPVDIPITSKFADLLAILPATSEAIYKHMRASRAKTVAIRNQLERQGVIVLKGKEWHKV